MQSAQGLFFCSDLNGGPPTDRDASSYILVTDVKGEGIVYHEGWVQVGQPFTLDDDGNNFEANMLVTIWNSEDMSDPNNILQSMQYHSSCSSNLFLKDRFGAIQLIQWINEDQGVISCFANQTFDMDITIPIEIEGGPATLTSLTVASNVDPFFFNLTDQVAGTVLDGGETLSTSINIPLDMTTRKTYNLLMTVFAVTESGRICKASNLQSFSAGDPLPPLFPTFAPTSAPTGTDPPTPDPETARCNLEADIECRTASGRTCRSISATSNRVCDSDDDPNSLTFKYTGKSCLAGSSFTANGKCREMISGLDLTQEEVYITVESDKKQNKREKNDKVLRFGQVVGIGETFVLSSGLGRESTIVISSVVSGGPGTELQRIEKLNTHCRGQEGEDLTLLQDYGAIQLVGFDTNEQGEVNTEENILLKYVIRNEGSLPAVLLSAVKENPFLTDPTEQLLIESSQTLEPGEDIEFLEIRTLDMEEADQDYNVGLYITGEGLQSGRSCFDRASYFFQID